MLWIPLPLQNDPVDTEKAFVSSLHIHYTVLGTPEYFKVQISVPPTPNHH